MQARKNIRAQNRINRIFPEYIQNIQNSHIQTHIHSHKQTDKSQTILFNQQKKNSDFLLTFRFFFSLFSLSLPPFLHLRRIYRPPPSYGLSRQCRVFAHRHIGSVINFFLLTFAFWHWFTSPLEHTQHNTQFLVPFHYSILFLSLGYSATVFSFFRLCHSEHYVQQLSLSLPTLLKQRNWKKGGKKEYFSQTPRRTKNIKKI